MGLFLAIVLWCVLFILSPVVAVAALILYPVVWLLTLPLRLMGVCVEAVFAFLKALLFLPARLLRVARAA